MRSRSAASRRRRITKWDWLSLLILCGLLAAWYLSGCRFAWMQHLIIGFALLYLFVIRTLINLKELKERNRPEE